MKKSKMKFLCQLTFTQPYQRDWSVASPQQGDKMQPGRHRRVHCSGKVRGNRHAFTAPKLALWASRFPLGIYQCAPFAQGCARSAQL